MRWFFAAGAALLWVAGVSAAKAQPAEDRSAFVILKGPEAKDDRVFFPNGPPATGEVYIDCTITAAGGVIDCALREEQPAGAGLAAPAMELVKLYRLRPTDRAGKPVAGRRVILGQEFVNPNENPVAWMQKPSAMDLAAVVPARAVAEGVGGRAVLHCRVTVENLLVGCVAEREEPAGYGFGEAALQIMPQLKMRAATRNGKPFETDVRIPLIWSTTGSDERKAAVGLMPDPLWVTAPSAAAVLQARPSEARATSGGQVMLQCFLAPEGTTVGCRPASENPKDAGFGRAAIGLGRGFSVKFEPGTVPEPGKTMVLIPIQFPPAAAPLAPLSEVRFARGLPHGSSQQLFPAAAKAAQVAVGVGTVDCLVGAGGALTDCKVVAEEPAGLGFGAAATEASKLLALKLWTASGEAVIGRRVALPLRFRAEAAKP